MNCKEMQNLIPDFLDGIIGKETGKQCEDHMAKCEACRKEVETMSALWTKMAQVPLEEPSPEVGKRFYSMLDVYTHGMNVAPAKTPVGVRISEWMQAWWPKRPAIQMAFALVFITVSFLTGRLTVNEKQPNDELTGLRAEMSDMRQLLTLSLLNQSSAIDRLRGVSMSREITDPDEQFLSALIKRLNTDPDVNVRIAAVNAMSKYSDRDWVRTELVSSLPRQTSPNVQVALIDLLAYVKEKQAVDAFQQIIDDQRRLEPVKKRARFAMEQII